MAWRAHVQIAEITAVMDCPVRWAQVFWPIPVDYRDYCWAPTWGVDLLFLTNRDVWALTVNNWGNWSLVRLVQGDPTALTFSTVTLLKFHAYVFALCLNHLRIPTACS